MPLPQALGGLDPCALADRWGLTGDLATRLVFLADRWKSLGLGALIIFSGRRSRTQQGALGRQGRPAAPFSTSTHADEDLEGCPRFSTGADVKPATITDEPISRAGLINAFHALAESMGLRAGGGSALDTFGNPTDWQHLDLGPRSTVP